MVENTKNPIRIDLNEFKLYIHLKKIQLTLHFDSPSRRFYLSVIALVVNEMKRLGRITSIPLEKHLSLLVLLNETIGGSTGSSDKERLLPRIYRKWKDALPDLEDAPLFKVLGRRKEYDEGIGRTYPFPEAEKDSWANLFEYQGSEENVRLKLAIDRVGATLDDIVIVYGDSLNGDAWERFLSNLKEKEGKNLPETEAIQSPLEVPESRISPIEKQKIIWQGRRRWAVLVALIVVIAAAATLATWKLYLKPTPGKRASVEKMAFPIPGKPSIAVLPFVNMSEDPKQEYFSDGMTEDLITDLSKISGLLVIARNSTFPYKGKRVKVKQVAEELGVRYVLEGSVRRAGVEIRINAQLVDALSGHHLWAERYDGKMDRIFALQDQITQKIVSALAVKLTGSEKEQVSQRGTDNIAAYDVYLEGTDHLHRFTADGFLKAAAFFKKAIELDPNYGQAYAALASVHMQATSYSAFLPGVLPGLKMSWPEARLRAAEYTRMAMKKPTALAYAVSSGNYLCRRQHKEAISEVERGLALDPNSPGCHAAMGYALTYTGRPKEGIEYFNKWIRLDPRDRYTYLYACSFAHFCMGEIAEAAKLLEQALRFNPEVQAGTMALLAACYSLLGRDQDARAIIDRRRKNPNAGATVADTMFVIPFKDRAVADRLAEGLIKAGLPPGKIAGGYFPAFKENQLTGEEIKRLNWGRTITGIGRDGQHWWVDIKKNGELTLRAGEQFSDTGKKRIDGDMECIQFQKLNWGLEYCLTIFRNPRGTYEGKDEYFECSDVGFTTWSVVR
jgi:adenylate cyclase